MIMEAPAFNGGLLKLYAQFVPIPGTLLLLALALAGPVAVRRRFKK